MQGKCKEMCFTRKWQGKIQKLKEIARISNICTSHKSKTTLTSKSEPINSIGLPKEVDKNVEMQFPAI